MRGAGLTQRALHAMGRRVGRIQSPNVIEGLEHSGNPEYQRPWFNSHQTITESISLPGIQS